MKVGDVFPVFDRYRGKGLLLDTNLLLLYFVGLVSPTLLSSFKPTMSAGFSEADFALLLKISFSFKKIIITPHILTEVSNHSEKLKGASKQKLLALIAHLVREFQEQACPSSELCARDDFQKFGLADVAIAAIPPGSCLVMTVDFPLVGHLNKQGTDVINFNHLRQMVWDEV